MILKNHAGTASSNGDSIWDEFSEQHQTQHPSIKSTISNLQFGASKVQIKCTYKLDFFYNNILILLERGYDVFLVM